MFPDVKVTVGWGFTTILDIGCVAGSAIAMAYEFVTMEMTSVRVPFCDRILVQSCASKNWLRNSDVDRR